MGTKKAWIYYRVANGDPEAVENQKRELLNYAENNGYEVIGESYDIGSGNDINREGLNKALTAVNDTLLIKDISRIGRDMSAIVKVLSILNKQGVKLISVDTGNIDINTIFPRIKNM